MPSSSCIVIFDVGKTNKKMLVFDESYRLVHEESQRMEETTDEDGFPCEDLATLSNWILNSFAAIRQDPRFHIKAVNFSAYGASFVYLDEAGRPIAPLYNYLKPLSPTIQDRFYRNHGGASQLAKQTASPVLGNLNSGLQVYRIREEKPELWKRIRYALHLPQYLSHLVSGKFFTDITSIGCHTHLWDFQSGAYHPWVASEGLLEKFAPLLPCDQLAATINGVAVGAGLHDSSAALIPYLAGFEDPFLLLSTGTWCISLNPFNHLTLSDYELDNDCLCYLSFQAKPVKASRLFAGHEHEEQTKRLAAHFQKPEDYYKTVKADPLIIGQMVQQHPTVKIREHHHMIGPSIFSQRKLADFADYETAYHCLIGDLIQQQVRSTHIVLHNTGVKSIFVDGGFSRNPIYMQLLAMAYPEYGVYAATVPQASAIGAALAVHERWNSLPRPAHLIQLVNFRAGGLHAPA